VNSHKCPFGVWDLRLYRERSVERFGILALILAVGLLTLVACGPPEPMQVTIAVDGGQRVVQTTGATVRDVLGENGIILGELDRVEPDLWVETTPGMTVTVIRVEEKQETVREVVPFQHKTVKSEAMAEGETRLIQAGANGEVEITYRVLLEDGVEVARNELSRATINPAVDEIVVVGTHGALVSVPITGTITYLSAGNAWLMREASGGRRPLTSEGDLDSRVFALSPDGRQLLFTRSGGTDPTAPLNTLWVITTTLLGETAQPLDLEGLNYGQWSSDGRRFAYSTAERTEGSPGWKANNDLWIASFTETGASPISVTQILSPSAESVYSWWGIRYAWSPDERYFAYAQADQAGIIDAASGERTPLIQFPVYHTYGEWVWTPGLSWSPDSRFIACVVHGPSETGEEIPQDSPVFDVWVVSIDGQVQVKLVSQAGMWAAPHWSPVRQASDRQESSIAYGRAQDPYNSQLGLYDLYVVDRDGSNEFKLFPSGDELGLEAPQMAWSPDGDQLVIAHNGNLYRLDVANGQLRQLNADGESGHPRWSR
jgi:Tol biopolymer transport system component